MSLRKMMSDNIHSLIAEHAARRTRRQMHHILILRNPGVTLYERRVWGQESMKALSLAYRHQKKEPRATADAHTIELSFDSH